MVLVADYNPLIADLYTVVLRRAGYEPTVVRTVEDARTAVAKEYFDLILLDALLLHNGATDLVRDCKRLNPYTPVLLMAHDAAQNIVQRNLAAGAAACIDKPLRVAPFLEHVRSFIDIYREPASRGIKTV